MVAPMRYSFKRLVCAVAAVLMCAVLEGATISRQQAESFERKVDQISAPQRAPTSPRRTPVTQDEINSWFTFGARPVLPQGVTDPQITMIGGGRMAAQATVDLEAIGRRRSSGGWLDPWTLLGGRLPLAVTGSLETKDGMGRFSIESSTLGGVPIPTGVVQELLSLYSRSPERPSGVRLGDSFPLPLGIRQIEVGPGQAVVVQ
jgi:hypothetical protein